MWFPFPPAAGTFLRMFKIGRTHRTVLLNMPHQLFYFFRVLMHPCRVIFPAHLFRRQHTMADKFKVTAW
ncbi:Uncharacterised protein [Salmonella enterica subsp. enterica serovar Typhimurium str. DT104]|nr:Uncharacterised protein [Salmonella enterica subsp. enterica serovar Typhimurium str. DT104]